MTIDYRGAKLLWPGLYKAVHEILGDAHVIIPLDDELVAGKVNASSFEAKAMGATGPTDLTWTPSEALSAFDTPLGLTDPTNWKGIVPVVTFNGTDEEGDTPDDGFYTRDDAGAANGFSVGAWVNMVDPISSSILAKYDEMAAAEAREWYFYLDGGGLPHLLLIDESVNTSAARPGTTAVVAGQWAFVVATYDGAGGATAADTINIYLNAVNTNGTAANNASYVGMEDLTTKPTLGFYIGSGATGTSFFDGKMAGGPLGPFFCQKELSATEVLDLYHIGAHALGLA